MKENLWQKYCSFLDKDFKSQVQWNENYMFEYFKDWKNTKMANYLCPGGVKAIEGIPVTTYSDYPILHEFGEKIQALTKRIPRKKGENYCDYYDKLSRQIINMLDGWMADQYSFSMTTSGTSGESKWIVHGETFWQNLVRSIMSTIIICSSEERGKTSFTKKDILFGIGSSAPYFGGYFLKAVLSQGINLIPPVEVMDEVPDFKKKIGIALKAVKKAGKIDIIGGAGSIIKLFTLYFINRVELFRESFKSTKAGILKIILWFLWKYEQAFGKKLNKLKDLINPKGVFLGSFDTELYLEYVIEQLELEPVDLYGATEIGFPLYGRPERKSDFFPDLRVGYFEFLDKNENIRKIDKLEKGEIYELVFTPYRSIIVRYKIGDLLKVIDFQKDGLPILNFESRAIQILDIYNYYRITLSLAFKAFKRAGFPPSNNWAFTKEMEPREHLVLLMEKELDLTEKQVSEKLYHALIAEDQSFKNYIADFKITDPEEVIKVEYLKRGAFKRYANYKTKEGVPLGRIKPFRIISPLNREVITLLRSA